jgi:hypothetical protein
LLFDLAYRHGVNPISKRTIHLLPWTISAACSHRAQSTKHFSDGGSYASYDRAFFRSTVDQTGNGLGRRSGRCRRAVDDCYLVQGRQVPQLYDEQIQ